MYRKERRIPSHGRARFLFQSRGKNCQYYTETQRAFGKDLLAEKNVFSEIIWPKNKAFLKIIYRPRNKVFSEIICWTKNKGVFRKNLTERAHPKKTHRHTRYYIYVRL